MSRYDESLGEYAINFIFKTKKSQDELFEAIFNRWGLTPEEIHGISAHVLNRKAARRRRVGKNC